MPLGSRGPLSYLSDVFVILFASVPQSGEADDSTASEGASRGLDTGVPVIFEVPIIDICCFMYRARCVSRPALWLSEEGARKDRVCRLR